MRFTKKFWKAAGIRAFRTFCQTFSTAIPMSAVILSDVPWVYVISSSALAGIVSLVTSCATGLPEVED